MEETMNHLKSLLAVSALSLSALALSPVATGTAAIAADPYYKGKTIKFVVGYRPGGGSDLSCRVFAKHMSKHVAGNPTIIVQNMPGASGANALNYVGEVARPDGLTAICGTLSILLPILEDPALRVDLRKFHYIAGVADSQVMYVRSDVKPGIKKATDVFNAQGLVLGGFRVTSAKDIPERLLADMLGLKYRYVTGLRGDGGGRAAMKQGIINLYLEAVASFGTITMPTMVKSGAVVPLFQTGLLDDNGNLTQKDPALPDIPTFHAFYKSKFGKDPAGQKWDALLSVLGPYAVSQRSIALSPNAPKEAVAALRAGVPATLKDKGFLEDAKKSMGEGIQAFGGDRVQKTILKALDVKPEMKSFFKAYVEEGKKLAGRK
jgi:tripartite-type tricarboxylate transporter receptor subunit TctC